MNKKVIKYLSKKNNYTVLDKILSFYASGEFERLLKDNNATEILFYPTIKKKNKLIEVYFKYFNTYVNINFAEENYIFNKYTEETPPDEFPEEFDNSIKIEAYNDGFDIEVFIKNFIKNLESGEKFEKRMPNIEEIARKEKKQKIYLLIARISFWMLMTFSVVTALYCIITGKSLHFDRWIEICWGILLITWCIFEIISTKKRNN